MSGQTLYERVEALKLLDDSGTQAAAKVTPKGAQQDAPKKPPNRIPLVTSHSWSAQPRNDLRTGERYRGRRITFCPWNIVAHYHEWFVGKKSGDAIQPYFQDSALLECKVWDFYYVWHPSEGKKDKYALVVPTDQLLDLISRLNETLDLQLAIPIGAVAPKFRVVFGDFGSPVPRFLGHAVDPTAFASMIGNIPPPDPRDDIYCEPPRIGPQAQAAYLRRVDGLFQNHDKNRRKKNKSDKSQQRTLSQRRDWGKQAKRVQRYLGLRGKVSREPRDATAPKSSNWDKPAPFQPEQDVLFVAIDIESYEFNSRMVTEIGFGILDTRHLPGVAPGERGKKWLPLVRGRHIRIREHAHAVNRIHVHGYENNFNFGTSEFVSLRAVPQLLKEILQPKEYSGELRKVILVGHGISSDLNFVKNAGFDISRDARFLEIVDTQDMHRHFQRQPQQVGLARLLSYLDIDHSFLHNGGNDAVYTLQAMVALSVEQRQGSLQRHFDRHQPEFKPDPTIEEAGWDTGGEMSDGGYPEHDWKDPAAMGDPASSTVEKKSNVKPAPPISEEEASKRWGGNTDTWPLLPPKQASSPPGTEAEAEAKVHLGDFGDLISF